MLSSRITTLSEVPRSSDTICVEGQEARITRTSMTQDSVEQLETFKDVQDERRSLSTNYDKFSLLC